MRCSNYTRKVKAGGWTRYFSFVEAFYGDHEGAKKLAKGLRDGTHPGHYGYRGPHWVRIFRWDKFGSKIGDMDVHDSLKVWAVYAFPKDEED